MAMTLVAAFAAASLALSDVRVVDGDTFDAGGERYRAIGYDTPEIGRFARCPAEDALGRRASARAAALIASARRIEAVRPAWRWRRDQHGRRLAEIRLDGRDIGAILIAEGLARPYRRGARPDWCGGGR